MPIVKPENSFVYPQLIYIAKLQVNPFAGLVVSVTRGPLCKQVNYIKLFILPTKM